MRLLRLIALTSLLFLLIGAAQAIPANGTIKNGSLVLYIPMNGTAGCTTFFDYSLNKTAIASIGTGQTPSINTSQYIYGGASGYFPGPGFSAYIRPAASSMFSPGVYPFSIAFWMKSGSLPTNTRIYSAGSVGSQFEIEVVNHHIAVYSNPIAVHSELSATVVDDNNWHYIVVERRGDEIRGYVDGVYGGFPVATTEAIGDPSTAPYIGALFTASNAYNGHLDDFQMYTSTSFFNGTFVPSAEVIANPRSGFSTNTTGGNVPLAVAFTNTTQGNALTSIVWNATTDLNSTAFTINSGSLTPKYTFVNAGNYLVNLTVKNQFGASSSYAWINVTNASAVPTASFTMTNVTPALSSSSSLVSGYEPTTVSFADTSTGFNGTLSYQWTYTPISTGTPVLFSTAAMPSHAFTAVGNYSIKLNVTNAYYTNTSTQSSWVNLSAQPQIVADFAANVTSQTIPPGAIQFTDKSSGYTPDTWLWNFGDGSTSTSENPAHTYSGAGLYTVSMMASRSDNATNTDTETKTNYINITYSPFYVHADFVGNPVSGSPGLLVSFTDLTIVGNATAPRTCNWSFGDSLSTTPYSSSCGNVQHVYTYGGVYDVNLSVTVLGNTSYMLKQQYISVSTNQNQQQTWYSPHQVRYKIVDANQDPIVGANVSCYYVATSLPSTNTSWLASAYGIPEAVTLQMLNSSLAMSGTTDYAGYITFTQHGSLQYLTLVTSVSKGVTNYQMYVYPLDNEYILQIVTNPVINYNQNNTVQQIYNTTLWVSFPNTSYVRTGLNYTDTSGKTTDVKFYVWDGQNGSVYYSVDLGNPGTTQTQAWYDLPNLYGAQYFWNYTATRTT